MFATVWQRCRRQFVDSGYYVEYGAENKLERNYSRQHIAVMRRAQYGTVDALDYSPQHDAERGPQYGTGEDYSRQQVAVMRPQYGTEDCTYISKQYEHFIPKLERRKV